MTSFPVSAVSMRGVFGGMIDRPEVDITGSHCARQNEASRCPIR